MFEIDNLKVAPPPPESYLSKHGYHTMSAISDKAMQHSGAYGYGGIAQRRTKTEEEWVVFYIIEN